MQRFEQIPKKLDKWKDWYRWAFFLLALFYFVIVFFWGYQSKLRHVMDAFMCVSFIVTFYPPNRKDASIFVEISDDHVHWYTFKGLEKDVPSAELLQWKEITMIKHLKDNELMFFEENDFYHRLHPQHFSVDQQKEIINAIRDCAERFSIRWIDKTAKAA